MFKSKLVWLLTSLAALCFTLPVFAEQNTLMKVTEGPVNGQWYGVWTKEEGNAPEIYHAEMHNFAGEPQTYKVLVYRLGNQFFMKREDSSDGINCWYIAEANNITDISGRGLCDNRKEEPMINARIFVSDNNNGKICAHLPGTDASHCENLDAPLPHAQL